MPFNPENRAFLITYLRDNIGFIKRLFDEKSVFGSPSRHVLELINDGKMNIDHWLLDIKNSMNLISLEKRPLTTNDIRAIAIVDAAFELVRQGKIDLYHSLDFLSEKDDDTIASHTAQITELLGPHKTSSSHSSGFGGRSEASASTSSSSMSSSSSSSSPDFARLRSSSEESPSHFSIEVDPATPLLDENDYSRMKRLLTNEWEHYDAEERKLYGSHDENREACAFFGKMRRKDSYSTKDLQEIRARIGKNLTRSLDSSLRPLYSKNQTSILEEITNLLEKHKKPSKTTVSTIPFFSSFDNDSKPPSEAPLPSSKKPS